MDGTKILPEPKDGLSLKKKHMNISQNGINFIKQKEGISLKPYADTGGKMTIGIGHLIKTGESFPSAITLEKAEELLRKDLLGAENTINKYIEKRLDQNQFDALCSLCFNIGTTAFINSTLVKLLNQDKILKAAQEFTRWDMAEGRECPGLLKRRKDEMALFLS